MIEIALDRRETAAIIRLKGRLDSNTSPELEIRIFEIIDGGGKRLLIDGEALEYITSAGLRVLNKAAKRLKPVEGRIVLCNLADYVREVFEIAGFDRILPIAASETEALQRLATAS